MRGESKHIKCWIVTKDGEKIACYSFNEFISISPSRIGRFIIPDSEINNAISRNRKKLKQIEPIFRKRRETT
jgi:hypothetical protein